MNQQSEHLSDAQIEQYGKSDSGAGPETEAWVETHLDDCPLCRGRVLDFQRTQFALLPNPKVKTVPTSACPSEEDLRDLAAGLYSEPIAQKLKAHAATCDHCGPLLQEYIEDFSDNFTPEEQAALDQLSSASPKWQRQTAREMLEQAHKNPDPVPPTDWRKFFSWKWMMVPALPAVALIAFGLWYLQRDTPEKVAKMLDQTYAKDRTVAMRWPGMAWGEPRETLGPASGKKPRTLLAAEDAIQRQTPETLWKTEWLHLRAQSELLGGSASQQLQQLIEDLTKASQSQPATQSLMFDLAITNFRMGEITYDRSYYLRSKDLFDKLIASFPPSPAALFDRALVEQQLQLKDLAIADLTKCLKLENDAAWSAEIQERIHKLESIPNR